ncbi:serine/threonine protein kinase [Cryobacterium sp. MLB-32]|uniref:serine/threonine-protein kinase n=1 Tax=Cryobacterium sp. MLB-32 TaxID=1529318 RepID=UPI0004E72C4F|nr:serine/threonine-protein kinase [Cryobacterium sp. MLB-32]KFF60906.1 serine/threonine protein kinase [Cryobacterium sp. MLB-32]
MSRRLPSTAPSLPGFTYVRALGSGGFADVFLFEQNLPRRPVAIKVLLAGVVTDEVRQLFRAEANVMAQLGSHPSILTVFQSSVSADGRPYLVMEYCSATLSQRYRSEPLAVPEVLRIGIKIAGAVESAHRTGVLHRDIKPSNILITAYGHPVLSDFGIAATLADAAGEGAVDGSASAGVGMSIPWSAPEVLHGDVAGSIATEVWALGATLYSLLAGRSPFEVPGGDNESAALIARISRAKVPHIDRADVPARLEEILARAMSRRPDHRQHSVLELIRELQSVEAELGLTQTPLEVSVDDWAQATPADESDKTRITGVSVAVRQPVRRRATAHAHASAGAVSSTRTRDLSRTRRSRTQTSLTGSLRSGLGAARRPRALIMAFVAALVLVVAMGATAVTLLVNNDSTGIPRVSDIVGANEGGTIVFRWADPGVESSDTYVVQLRNGEKSIQRGTEFGVDPDGSGTVCVTVTVNRSGASGQPSGEKCVDPTVTG